MKFDIVKNRNIFFSISGVVVAFALLALIVFGLKPGIDFTGGSLIELSFTEDRPTRQEMQNVFADGTYGNVIVQSTEENSYILKMRFISEDEHQDILSRVRTEFQTDGVTQDNEILVESNGGGEVVVEIAEEDNSETQGDMTTTFTSMVEENNILEERIETIGPTISSQLKNRSIKAAIAVVLAIVIFIAYAFRKVSRPVQSWKYGLTAITALLHDVIITMGVFAVLGYFMGVEIDIPFVVAMLTVFGYSVNDTIVVFDRIRENLIKHGHDKFAVIVNKGVNETLIRSFNTSITTLIVLGALFFFGGDSIHYFSLALIIGIALGTYSSIFIASPLLVMWQKWSDKK